MAGGRKTFVAGTYVAEQRDTKTGVAYVLQGAGGVAKRRALETSSKSDGEKGAGQAAGGSKFGLSRRFDANKCLVLPALATIDPLLAATSRTFGKPTHTPSDDGLPPVTRLARMASREALPMGTSRLWQSPRSPTCFGESATLVPTDTEFKAWLTLPRIATRDWTSPSSTRIHASSASPETPRSSNMRSPTHENAEGFDDAGQTSTARAYHVLLLRKTFANTMNTIDHVASVLAEHLQLEEAIAKLRTNEACVNVIVSVAACPSETEAFSLAQKLRREGLSVQVASRMGLPDGTSGIGGRRRRIGHDTNYSELIQHGLRNTDIAGHHRTAFPLVLPPVGRKSEISWRQEEVPIHVLPEDPVAALLDAPILPEGGPATPRGSSPRFIRGGRCRFNTMRQKVHNAYTKSRSFKVFNSCIDSSPRSRTVNVSSVADSAILHGAEDQEECANDTTVDAESASAKAKASGISKSRKDACLLLRYFVFGAVGNEGGKASQDRDQIFNEAMGTKEQVQKLYWLWKKVDYNDSGRADLGEFRSFVEEQLRERLSNDGNLVDATDQAAKTSAVRVEALPDWLNVGCDPVKDFNRFLSRVVDRMAVSVLGRKSNFSLEDMMRAIWPMSGLNECKLMLRWCKEVEQASLTARVGTPPILDAGELDGLCSVFRQFDGNNDHKVTFDEIVAAGLIYSDQIDTYRREWDANGDDSLDILEFCEMMCPLGFRAHHRSKIGTQHDGTRVVFDSRLGGWRVESDFLGPQHQEVREEERDETVAST
mmetsp:Transcript_111068/g.313283  ORF Transcript_111068/g.313283 Transcript_111068/m.313283 type:complete len:768 (-) Transcript_111068:71-2374(-)